VAADWTVDTNILIYCVDRSENEKRAVAESLMLAADRADISLARQTIGEFFHAASRKGKLPFVEAAAVARNYLQGYEIFEASGNTFETALEEAATGRTQFWDALLLAACAENGIAVLLTEDMAEGRHRLGVEIVDPFKPGAAAKKTLKRLGIAPR
jgi:predicted nucleic acid-binding protein